MQKRNWRQNELSEQTAGGMIQSELTYGGGGWGNSWIYPAVVWMSPSGGGFIEQITNI